MIMITEITMQGVYPYNDKIEIKGLKKKNFFYGLNGSGKTVISRFLANADDAKFSKCTKKWDTKEILVFNQDYTEDTFHNVDTQEGIITLDTVNKTAEETIATAKIEKLRLEAEKRTRKEETEKEVTTLKDRIYKIGKQDIVTKEHYGSLKKCLKGKTQKGKFSEKLEELSKNDKIETSLDDLAKEMSKSGINDESPSPLSNIDDTIKTNLSTIEKDDIWQEEIVGSQNSIFKELIEKLTHSDWLRQGIVQYIDKTDDCPFCTQNINEELKSKIKSYIDQAYQDKIRKLKRLQSQYLSYQASIQQIVADCGDKISNHDVLINHIKDNIRVIEEKIEKPSTTKELIDSSEVINNIMKQISEYNSKINNKKETLKNFTTEFWQILRNICDVDIIDYQQKENELDVFLDEQNRKIEEQKKTIDDNESKASNISEAMTYINSILKQLGITNFHFDKVEGENNQHKYKIIRTGGTENGEIFKTLSEGEKSLVTFLYFLQSCFGASEQNKSADLNNRIIVIDDPIDSLSFNYMFEIATLIKNKFLGFNNNTIKFSQIFILTHHLYFFHELLGTKKIRSDDKKESKSDDKKEIESEDRKLYRISKIENNAKVACLKPTDIQNDYQANWQLLNSIKETNEHAVALPIVMRQIIEYFFGFIDKQESLNNIKQDMLAKLPEEKLMIETFFRQIDRGSHHNMTNVNDAGSLGSEKYFEYFEKIFEQQEYKEHYKKYMK